MVGSVVIVRDPVKHLLMLLHNSAKTPPLDESKRTSKPLPSMTSYTNMNNNNNHTSARHIPMTTSSAISTGSRGQESLLGVGYSMPPYGSNAPLTSNALKDIDSMKSDIMHMKDAISTFNIITYVRVTMVVS